MKYTKRMLVSALVLCTITQLSGCKEQNKSNTKPSTEKTSVQTDITETYTTNAIDLPTHTSSDYSESESSETNRDLSDFTKKLPFCDISTGFAGNSSDEIDKHIMNDNVFDLQMLPEDNNDLKFFSESNPVIYKFQMQHMADVELNDGAFITGLYMNNNQYVIMLGAEKFETTLEEAQIYATKGNIVTYYAMGFKDNNDNIILVPLIAGHDTTGYYTVRPNVALLGFDISSMPDYSKVPFPVLSENNQPTEQSNFSDSRLVIDSVEFLGNDSLINFTYINKETYPTWIKDCTVYVNGEPLSEESAHVYISAESNSESQNSFTVFDRILSTGDILTFKGTLVRTDTYEDIQPVSVNIEL